MWPHFPVVQSKVCVLSFLLLKQHINRSGSSHLVPKNLENIKYDGYIGDWKKYLILTSRTILCILSKFLRYS